VTCFSKVFHARHISMHMSLNGTKHMYSDNQLDCICVLWDVMYLECTYTCIPQRFRRTVYVYNRNASLWFNVGCECILVFPKCSKELYACNAVMFYPLFSYNVMFGSMRILEFPTKVQMTCMRKKQRHSVSYFLSNIRMHVFFQRFESLYTNVSEWHDIYVMVCIL